MRRMLLAIVSGSLLAFGNSPMVLADSKSKRAVGKIFTSAIAKANESTVRVRSDGKDVALGTIVDSAGFIVTKASELKGEISIRFRDGSEFDAKYIGFEDKADLALLKVDTALTAVKFADKDKVIVGNFVAAPGMDETPAAVGVVSVGVRALKGFESIIENANKGYMGAQLKDRDDKQDGAEIFGLTDPKEGRSAAREAKLKVGDIIIRLNDMSIKKRDDLMTILAKSKPGDQVTLVVIRDDEEMEFKFKLLPKSSIDRSEMQNRMGGALSARRTGFPAVIQHDMVLKPIDCGGPLVDIDGNVIGINIARAGRVETWALPPDLVTKLIGEIKEGKHRKPEVLATTKEKPAETKSDPVKKSDPEKK
jgi:serine protease Do